MSIQTAQDLLRTTLSHSAAMQSFLGAGNQAAALARIYNDALPPGAGDKYTVAELEALRPCVIVSTERWRSLRQAAGDSVGDVDCWSAEGQLRVGVYRTVPSNIATDLSQVDTTMRTLAATIAVDLINMSEQAGRLACTGIHFDGPFRVAPNELKNHGDEQSFILSVDWGSQLR